MNTILHRADLAYYNLQRPIMSDAEYDRLARECGHSSAFASLELPSLNNAIDYDELLHWIDRVPAGERYFYLEPKIDGVSVVVQYSDGQPVAMRSRRLDLTALIPGLRQPVIGEGESIQWFAALPEISGFSGAVRGECWHPAGRNHASGRIRARDTGAGLRFSPFAYDLPCRELLGLRGFEAAAWHATAIEPAEILCWWQQWRRGQIAPSVPTDGLVLSCARHETRTRLGANSRSPNWAIALK